jgi:hypothetical protein
VLPNALGSAPQSSEFPIKTHHGRHSEFTRVHLLREPVDLSPCVAENDSLRDRNSLIKIAQRIELPLLLFDGDIELLDTFEGKLVTLDKNTNGVAHELFRHLEHVCRHRGGEKDDLRVLGKKLEDFVDLVFEATRKHLIGLVKTEHLDGVGAEGTAVDHIKHTTGGADDDMDALLELGHVLTDVSATDARVAFDVHVVAEGDDDLLDLLRKFTGWRKDERLGAFDSKVELLENGDGKGSGLARAGLGLCDHIMTLYHGDDGTLLNG